jgi:hypothetical protein
MTRVETPGWFCYKLYIKSDIIGANFSVSVQQENSPGNRKTPFGLVFSVVRFWLTDPDTIQWLVLKLYFASINFKADAAGILASSISFRYRYTYSGTGQSVIPAFDKIA